MPSISHSWPNMNRVLPTCGSTPMVAIIRPTSPIISPFTSPPPTSDSAVSPTSTSEKYSGGPKYSAAAASGGASSISPSVPTVPAKNEPIAAMPSAAPARPLRAI